MATEPEPPVWVDGDWVILAGVLLLLYGAAAAIVVAIVYFVRAA